MLHSRWLGKRVVITVCTPDATTRSIRYNIAPVVFQSPSGRCVYGRWSGADQTVACSSCTAVEEFGLCGLYGLYGLYGLCDLCDLCNLCNLCVTECVWVVESHLGLSSPLHSHSHSHLHLLHSTTNLTLSKYFLSRPSLKTSICMLAWPCATHP